MKNTAEKTLLNTVKRTIRENGLIPKGSTVILGLSGGPDSLCLLYVLNGIKAEFGFELAALHVNHMLRGEAADLDEAFVEKTCEELGIKCRIVKQDAAKFAEQNGLTVEEAGRTIRHNALREYSEELGGALVAIAHNMDDQAETVLMRLIRGTGVHGLGAMEYKREDGVIRPLLDVPRSLIEEYCETTGLSPRRDLTNDSCDYTRNRIRHELLPELSGYNPRITDALVRLAKSAREDDAALVRAAGDFTEKHCRTSGPQGAASSEFSVKELSELEIPVFMRVMAISIKNAGLLQDLSAERLSGIRKAVLSGKGGLTIELPKGIRVRIGKGKVLILPPQN